MGVFGPTTVFLELQRPVKKFHNLNLLRWGSLRRWVDQITLFCWQIFGVLVGPTKGIRETGSAQTKEELLKDLKHFRTGLTLPCCCTCFLCNILPSRHQPVHVYIISFYSKYLQSKLKILSPSFLFQHSFL